jgi:hypothetical protein
MGVGIYGDMLAAFGELIGEYTVFKLPAKMGAGYGGRYDERTVRGYLSRNAGGRMGVMDDLRVENDEAAFWEEDESEDGTGRIAQGDYLEDGGDLFIFNHDDRFTGEGGFLVHRLQLVPAFTGKQVPDQRVDLAADFG